MSGDYQAFIESKTQLGGEHGFAPLWMPDFLYDFQKHLVEWSLVKGRSAIFADCGLGKTPMQLVWAENVVRKTGKPVLIATPLAVSYQCLREAEKFDIDCARSVDGSVDGNRIIVTNYERLDRFNPADFAGMVCDESSILKNFNGVRRASIQEFMRRLPYRLLCTATAAPNDYIELGTSSEALGELGYMDMLSRFFRNTQGTSNPRMMRMFGGAAGPRPQWRFRGHAETPFWQWVCSWARAVRMPSDLGFDNARFVLPPLVETEHVIEASRPREGMLFVLPAVSLPEQREERRQTIDERCAKVAELVARSDQALVWCHLNAEGNLLAKMIGGAEQVSGSDSDEKKEQTLLAFADGDLRVLVTKPKIGAWGLNLQQCSHVTFFPSHSYEQYYQGVRRCWRFGLDKEVQVDIVTTKGEVRVMTNLRKKAERADRMFGALVEHMGSALRIEKDESYVREAEVPTWL